MGVIVTLIPHPTRLQRLRAAVRDRHTVVPCTAWAEVTRTCETEPVHLAVLDLYGDGPAAMDRVRVIKLRFPMIALLAYVAPAPDRLRDMFDAGRIGFDGLVIADVDDDPASLLTHLEKGEARTAAALVRPLLAPEYKANVRDATLACVTRAHERLSPEALARLLEVPRRLLASRLHEAGFPPPARLITWGRLIVAAHMLASGDRSADSVANALDFPSGSAFRNTCQRYLHATPQEIRARGGATFVVDAFFAHVGTAEATEGEGEAERDEPAGEPGGESPTA